MKFQDLKNHFGKQVDLAKVLNVTPQAVNRWKDMGIPVPRQFQIEVLTNGKLKAQRTESLSVD